MHTVQTVFINALDSEGRGVGRLDGPVVFVPGALPGERAEIRIAARKKNYAEGELVRVLEASPDRIAPPCPHFGVCGGCGLQHLRYPAQLDYKRKKVSDALTRIAKLPDTEVAPAVPCSRPLRYRNKLSLPVRAAAGRETQSAEGGTAAEGSIAVGLYKKNSREICPLDDCLLQPKTFGAAARAVAAFMRENRVSAYDEKSGAGTVLRLILRSVGAFAGGVAGGCAEGLAGETFLQKGFPRAPFQKSSATLQITVVVNGKDLPRKEKLIETLRERFGGDFSLWVNRVAANIDPVREKNRKDCAERFRGGSDRAAASGAAITGKEYAHVGGAEYLPAMVFGLRLNLHPAAFFQVNDEIAAALFQAVSETVKAAGVKTVIDAYCGAGLLTCVLGKFCERAVGIEISPEAVAAARRLASENGMTNAEFIEGDCGAVLPRLLRGGNARCSTRNAQINARCSTRDSRLNDGNQNTETALILDPPRAGCPPSVINAILSNPPALVCYISCGPATLARDLSALKERYAVQSVRPFDMFPQTPHVETLCVLARDKF